MRGKYCPDGCSCIGDDGTGFIGKRVTHQNTNIVDLGEQALVSLQLPSYWQVGLRANYERSS